MSSIKYFYRVFIFMFIASSVQAQSPWTLQQCIAYALDHNIQIRQSEMTKELSAIGYKQSITNLFPTLNGYASQNYYYGRSIDPYTNNYTNQQIRSNSFSLSTSVPVFEGLQLQNSLKESHLAYMSSQFDLKKIQNDISLNVVTYYLQVLYNQENLVNTNDQVAATQVQRDKINRMYELGSVTKGNLLDLEAQLSNDQFRQVQAQSNLDQSMLLLTQLLELDSTKNFSIVKPELNVSQFLEGQINAETIYQVALHTQPEITSEEYKVAGAEKGLAVARGSRYPRISVGANMGTNYSTSSKQLKEYTYGDPVRTFTGYTASGDSVYTIFPNTIPIFEDTPFRRQLDNNLGKSVGFSMQIPILNNWNAKNNIQRAKINLQQSKFTQEQTKKNLYKSVQQAVADANSSYRKYEAGLKSVSSMEESFNYNQQKYDLGLISSYDYLQSKNNLAKSRADLLQARYDFIFRMKILDFYQGKALTF